MNNDRLAKMFINPLDFVDVEFYQNQIISKPSLEDTIAYLCGHDPHHDIDSLLRRYREIDLAQTDRFQIAPFDPQFMARIVEPLAQAKGSYMVSNFLGTIALCGMVCEMLTLLLFEVLPIHLGGQPMNETDQERMFGASLERLRQDRRVKILLVFRLIDDKIKGDFDCVRILRNKYLHVYSVASADPAKDACQAYSKTVSLVVNTLGYSIQNGKVHFRPEFMQYLEKKGIFQEPQSNETQQH
jgi:hypothetical protein